MGFGDEGIVALSGAHTLGRAQKVRVRALYCKVRMPLIVHVKIACLRKWCGVWASSGVLSWQARLASGSGASVGSDASTQCRVSLS